MSKTQTCSYCGNDEFRMHGKEVRCARCGNELLTFNGKTIQFEKGNGPDSRHNFL